MTPPLYSPASQFLIDHFHAVTSITRNISGSYRFKFSSLSTTDQLYTKTELDAIDVRLYQVLNFFHDTVVTDRIGQMLCETWQYWNLPERTYLSRRMLECNVISIANINIESNTSEQVVLTLHAHVLKTISLGVNYVFCVNADTRSFHKEQLDLWFPGSMDRLALGLTLNLDEPELRAYVFVEVPALDSNIIGLPNDLLVA